jgi:hypothetical protein
MKLLPLVYVQHSIQLLSLLLGVDAISWTGSILQVIVYMKVASNLGFVTEEVLGRLTRYCTEQGATTLSQILGFEQ